MELDRNIGLFGLAHIKDSPLPYKTSFPLPVMSNFVRVTCKVLQKLSFSKSNLSGCTLSMGDKCSCSLYHPKVSLDRNGRSGSHITENFTSMTTLRFKEVLSIWPSAQVTLRILKICVYSNPGGRHAQSQ